MKQFYASDAPGKKTETITSFFVVVSIQARTGALVLAGSDRRFRLGA